MVERFKNFFIRYLIMRNRIRMQWTEKIEIPVNL